ncbi:MAG: hypothetical protein ACFFCQ_08525 [Promethearchaeota archaeon]
MSNKLVEAIVESFMDQMDMTDTQKESHRLYLMARVENYKERLDFVDGAIDELIDAKLHLVSPFMFGYAEGMRRATSYTKGYKRKLLKKPTFWADDSDTEKLARLWKKYRKDLRRKTARIFWLEIGEAILVSGQFKANPGILEAHLMRRMKMTLEDIPPIYEVRKFKKFMSKITGVSDETIKNAKEIEDWWT